MEEKREFNVSLALQDGYRFMVDFEQPDVPLLQVDEPSPLGGGDGPNAARLLGAAVGNCLAASLLFCLQRARVEVRDLRVGVQGSIVRSDAGRFRIGGLRVVLQPDIAAEDRDRMDRCLGLFEDFCIVTQSIRDGVDVEVAVEPVADAAVV
jgi:organic hydroperoxide reductase OsmC/OhrA